MSALDNPNQEERILSDDIVLKEDLARATAKNGTSTNSTNTNGASANGISHAVEGVDQSAAFHDSIDQRKREEEDPFRYGYRDVEIVDEHGRIDYEQIPLTLDDLLHPQEEDFRVQNPNHIDTGVNLRTILMQALDDVPTSLVLYDVRVDWNVPGIEGFGPDITVILDADMQPKDKGTFVVGIDGIAPVMVIEMTSLSTRSQDFHKKPTLMQRLALPYYFVADLVPAPEKRRIYGYELTAEGCYIGIRPNEAGWVWMAPVKLWLGLQDGEVACYDVEGERMLGPQGLVESLEAQTQRADEEAQRANEEAQRANEEARRASEEAQRANEEARRADTLNMEKQRLEEYLRSIGVDPATIPQS